MKKSLLTAFFFLSLTYTYAQVYVPTTGGTFTELVNFDKGVNPLYEVTNYNDQTLLTAASFNTGLSFHNISGATGYPHSTGMVWTFKNGPTRTHRLHFSKNSNQFSITSWNSTTSSWNGWDKIVTDGNYNNVLGLVNSNGNIGIGTSNPATKLESTGTIRITSTTPVLHLRETDTSDKNFQIDVSGGNLNIRTNNDAFNSASTRLSIDDDGNIGIGTTSPSEKLEVNGAIRTKEVKVEASPWPDYVFEPDYELRSLEETEAFVKEHRHLPEIPSASELEANGLPLGEMNRLLMKKIEELTLHLIEVNRENTNLRQQLKANNQKQTEINSQFSILHSQLIERIEVLEANSKKQNANAKK